MDLTPPAAPPRPPGRPWPGTSIALSEWGTLRILWQRWGVGLMNVSCRLISLHCLHSVLATQRLWKLNISSLIGTVSLSDDDWKILKQNFSFFLSPLWLKYLPWQTYNIRIVFVCYEARVSRRQSLRSSMHFEYLLEIVLAEGFYFSPVTIQCSCSEFQGL